MWMQQSECNHRSLTVDVGTPLTALARRIRSDSQFFREICCSTGTYPNPISLLLDCGSDTLSGEVRSPRTDLSLDSDRYGAME
jgi:hypothetical protein